MENLHPRTRSILSNPTNATTRNQSILYADKRCRRLFRGEVAFTPELKARVASVRAWKLIVRKKEGWKVSSRLIVRLFKCRKIKTPCVGLMRLSMSEAKEHLKYRDFKKQAMSQQTTWLQELAQEQADAEESDREEGDNDKATAKHLRMIIAVEGTRSLF